MPNIKFVDLNPSLVALVAKETGLEAICGDVFEHEGVIVSASNPDFTMGAGLDAAIKRHYPVECAEATRTPGEQKRIGNIIFAITVDRDLRASTRLVSEALRFAVSNVGPNETLLLSGLGCGIGGMPRVVFVELLKRQLKQP